MLILSCLEGLERPKEVTVNTTPIWVQIFEFSFKRMTQHIVRFIGNVLGRTVEVDGNVGVLWDRCLRARVRIYVSRPLIRMLYLVFANDEEQVG